MYTIKGFIFIIQQVNKNADLSEQMAVRASPVYHNTEKPIPTVYQLPYSIFALTTTKNGTSTFKLLHKKTARTRKALRWSFDC